MKPSSQVSDKVLLALMPTLVLAERVSVAEVIEHLVEIDRRRLFLDQACGSLSAYCVERLGYSEDEAGKRVRVTRLASRLPQVLGELRSGAIHLTGLFLLAHHLTQENYEAVMSESRGQSKRRIEQLIAARAPKPDVPQRLCQLPEQALLAQGAAAGCPGTGPEPGPGASGAAAAEPGKLAPLSAARWSVQFTASAELRDKIEKARELLSHALPNGDLASLFERALDKLIERETKRRLGAGKPRQRRPLSPRSRHVPVEVARQVWQRDDYQCTFIDAQGRRCSSRRFLTIEHRQPFALGGPPTVDNLCLLCASHNAHAARQVFGEIRSTAIRSRQRAGTEQAAHAKQRRARTELAQGSWRSELHTALCKMGFAGTEVRRALGKLPQAAACQDIQSRLKAALELLVPRASRPHVDRAGTTSD